MESNGENSVDPLYDEFPDEGELENSFGTLGPVGRLLKDIREMPVYLREWYKRFPGVSYL